MPKRERQHDDDAGGRPGGGEEGEGEVGDGGAEEDDGEHTQGDLDGDLGADNQKQKPLV